MPPTLYLGADHAGFELKEYLKNCLPGMGYPVEDLTPGPADPQDDYPDAAKKVAEKALAENGRGVLICGSGNGICQAANKIKGVRAVVGYNLQAAKWASADGNSNILCLAGRVLKPDYAAAIVRTWLETPFIGEERHRRRIEKKLEEIKDIGY